MLVVPDHYVVRMLVSQGVDIEELGIRPTDGDAGAFDPEAVWRCFAEHYHLFRATPTRMWLDHTFETLFDLHDPLGPDTADGITNRSAIACYGRFQARALYERFGIEVLATTESAVDDLRHHAALADSGWQGRVVTTYRPDTVADPEHADFQRDLTQLGEITGCDVETWQGYLEAHRARRAFFRSHGATATDHGFASARTADLSQAECVALFDRVLAGKADAEDSELFPGAGAHRNGQDEH